MTAEQIKHRLHRKGMTLTQWAEQNGYPRNAVYRVINGQYKGHYGRAHEIAVALGLKSDPSHDRLAT